MKLTTFKCESCEVLWENSVRALRTAAFQGMHVSPVKSGTRLPRKCDYQTHRHRTKWSYATMLCRRHDKLHKVFTCCTRLSTSGMGLPFGFSSSTVAWHPSTHSCGSIPHRAILTYFDVGTIPFRTGAGSSAELVDVQESSLFRLTMVIANVSALIWKWHNNLLWITNTFDQVHVHVTYCWSFHRVFLASTPLKFLECRT